MTKPDDSAFPQVSQGLTKREDFAKAAMMGILAEGVWDITEGPPTAVAFADALIAALNAPVEPKPISKKIVCSKCRREIRQTGTPLNPQWGWTHWDDGTPQCEHGEPDWEGDCGGADMTEAARRVAGKRLLWTLLEASVLAMKAAWARLIDAEFAPLVEALEAIQRASMEEHLDDLRMRMRVLADSALAHVKGEPKVTR